MSVCGPGSRVGSAQRKAKAGAVPTALSLLLPRISLRHPTDISWASQSEAGEEAWCQQSCYSRERATAWTVAGAPCPL
jgi:hypothetical protein